MRLVVVVLAAVLVAVVIVMVVVIVVAAFGDHDATAQRAPERCCENDQRENFFHDDAPFCL